VVVTASLSARAQSLLCCDVANLCEAKKSFLPHRGAMVGDKAQPEFDVGYEK
jgi:hypothetical protein